MPKGSEAQSSNSVAEYSKDSWTSRRKKNACVKRNVFTMEMWLK